VVVDAVVDAGVGFDATEEHAVAKMITAKIAISGVIHRFLIISPIVFCLLLL
jgi:hypothetical protein